MGHLKRPRSTGKVEIFYSQIRIAVTLFYDEVKVAEEDGKQVIYVVDRELGEEYEVAPGAVINSSESLSFGFAVKVGTKSGAAAYRGELTSSKDMRSHVDHISSLLNKADFLNRSIHSPRQ